MLTRDQEITLGGGVRIIGGWKWFDITIIRGLEQSGGGSVIGEIENSRLLS